MYDSLLLLLLVYYYFIYCYTLCSKNPWEKHIIKHPIFRGLCHCVIVPFQPCWNWGWGGETWKQSCCRWGWSLRWGTMSPLDPDDWHGKSHRQMIHYDLEIFGGFLKWGYHKNHGLWQNIIFTGKCFNCVLHIISWCLMHSLDFSTSSPTTACSGPGAFHLRHASQSVCGHQPREQEVRGPWRSPWQSMPHLGPTKQRIDTDICLLRFKIFEHLWSTNFQTAFLIFLIAVDDD